MWCRTWLVSCGLIALGCSHSDSPVAPAHQVEDKQPARIEVTVNVDHPELSRPAYGIALDGKHLLDMATNSTVHLIVEGGHHTVSVEGTLGFWILSSDACTTAGSNTISGIYPAGQTSSITFNIRCTPPIASANLTLAVTATGTNIPNTVPLAINRDAFPPYQLLVDVRVGDTQTYLVPLGVYFIDIGGGNCHLSSGQNRAVAFVMNTRPATVTIAMTCG